VELGGGVLLDVHGMHVEMKNRGASQQLPRHAAQRLTRCISGTTAA
jgi:hypothetical protein